jgi:hypothetical protein
VRPFSPIYEGYNGDRTMQKKSYILLIKKVLKRLYVARQGGTCL